MQLAAELLPEVYRKLTREAADEEAVVTALWPLVVGGKVAARTRPVRLFKTTLIVETVSPDWRRQLARMSGDIVKQLNAAAGKPVVKDLEFRVAVNPPARPPRRAASATGLDEADAISDPHLRRLYRQSRRRAQAK